MTAVDPTTSMDEADWVALYGTEPPPDEAPTPRLHVVADSTPAPSEVEGFWQERPVLEHVQLFARARMVSPWALLAVSLVRTLAVVPPWVRLPPIVGSHASLNTFVALVGPSGGGKGAAESAAVDAFAYDVGIDTASVGSGEGVAHLFMQRVDGEIEQHRTSVVLSIPEVDTLVALKSRQGATLLPTLRSAWTGEALGHSNADKARTLPVPRHGYRLGLVLGVQPGRAAPLLDDSDGGTPQRFLWLPTTDRDAPDVPPDSPAPWPMQAHRWRPHADLTVPQVARRAIVENRRATLRGEEHTLDGHALLARLKVAQGLTVLDGRTVMTDDDWRLSAIVMSVSDRTRGAVQRSLARQAEASNVARASFEGQRAAVADDVGHELAVQRCARSIQRHLSARGETPRADVRKALASRDRRFYEDAVRALVAAGQIVVDTSGSGERLRLAGVDK